MDWQHGLAVLDFEAGDKPFYYSPIFINSFQGYEARFEGQTYRPSPKIIKQLRGGK
jgi:hypothetical protein